MGPAWARSLLLVQISVVRGMESHDLMPLSRANGGQWSEKESGVYLYLREQRVGRQNWKRTERMFLVHSTYLFFQVHT